MNLTTPVGQRTLGVDLICTHYVSEWKMKAVQICLSVEFTVDNTASPVEDVAHTLRSVCLMELRGVLLCPSWKNGMCEVYLEGVVFVCVPAMPLTEPQRLNTFLSSYNFSHRLFHRAFGKTPPKTEE